MESPEARKGPAFLARNKGNLLAYASGSLGIVVPPMKCTHRSEEYACVKEEWVTIELNICVVTPIHALRGDIALSANYPRDVLVRKHWHVRPPYDNVHEYVKSNIARSFDGGPPVVGLDAMLLANIHTYVIN